MLFERLRSVHGSPYQRWMLNENCKLTAEALSISHKSMEDLKQLIWNIPTCIDIHDIIAVGSYGVVAAGEVAHSPSNSICIKRSLNLKAHVTIAKAFWLELMLLKECQHPNIVPLLDSHYDNISHSLTFVMPRANLDLQKGLISPELYQHHERFFVDVANAVHYLHSNGFVHRDLTPSNVLLYQDGQESWHACLGDLGMACVAYSPEQTFQMFTTFPYRAPELFCEEGTTNPACDIWSLGCIYAEIIQKHSLFFYHNERLDVNEEWVIFGRHFCAMVSPDEMKLHHQRWIRSRRGQLLFRQVRSSYVQHNRLLWAYPAGTKKVEEAFLRQIMVMNPANRPTIDGVFDILQIKPVTSRCPQFSEAIKGYNFNDCRDVSVVTKILEHETSTF